MGLQMHKTAKVKSLYHFRKYILYPITSNGQVPMATFLKSHKSETAPPTLGTEWILAGPTESAVVFLGGATS